MNLLCLFWTIINLWKFKFYVVVVHYAFTVLRHLISILWHIILSSDLSWKCCFDYFIFLHLRDVHNLHICVERCFLYLFFFFHLSRFFFLWWFGFVLLCCFRFRFIFLFFFRCGRFWSWRFLDLLFDFWGRLL